jgi:hypothetical protein
MQFWSIQEHSLSVFVCCFLPFLSDHLWLYRLQIQLNFNDEYKFEFTRVEIVISDKLQQQQNIARSIVIVETEEGQYITYGQQQYYETCDIKNDSQQNYDDSQREDRHNQ